MRITSSTENRMQAWTTTFWDRFLHSFMPHINTECTLPPAMGQSVSSQDGQGRGLDTDLGPPRILSGTQMEICTVWCSLQQRGFSSLQLGGAGLVVRERLPESTALFLSFRKSKQWQKQWMLHMSRHSVLSSWYPCKTSIIIHEDAFSVERERRPAWCGREDEMMRCIECF